MKKFLTDPPTITNRRKTESERAKILELWRKFGEVHGFKLLSEEYVNNSTNLEWEDADGHRFTKTPCNLKNAGWTYFKGPKGRQYDKDVHMRSIAMLAEGRGGRLLSDAYMGHTKKLLFADAAGNKFEMTPNNIKNGHWSPFEGNVTEHLCRQIFEQVFNAEFPARNDIITREGKRSLQLDGYNENLRIGFEYQGFRSHKEDRHTISLDRYKNNFCSENAVSLVIIEKIHQGYKEEELISHVVDAIKRKLDNLPNHPPIKLSYENINYCKTQLRFWNEFGEKNGYKLVSKIYKNAKTKLEWETETGDKFFRSPATIRNSGFPTFSNKSKAHMRSASDHFSHIKSFGEKNGFELLSEHYIDYKSPLVWKSNEKQIIFERSWATIRKSGFPNFSKCCL